LSLKNSLPIFFAPEKLLLFQAGSLAIAHNVPGAGAVFALRFPGMFVDVEIANSGLPTEK
jgi:hypothetical protein